MNHNNNKQQMPTEITVGVLALQGAFHEHLLLLHQASNRQRQRNDTEVKWQFIQVRNRQQLEACDALIIPGGESTAVSLVAARSGLLEPLREFVKYACWFPPPSPTHTPTPRDAYFEEEIVLVREWNGGSGQKQANDYM